MKLASLYDIVQSKPSFQNRLRWKTNQKAFAMHQSTSGEQAAVEAVSGAVYVRDEAADLLANYKAISSLLVRLMIRDLIATLATNDVAVNDSGV